MSDARTSLPACEAAVPLALPPLLRFAPAYQPREAHPLDVCPRPCVMPAPCVPALRQRRCLPT
jgi:hypothetical protein